jgi:uncharacterized protein DUF4232
VDGPGHNDGEEALRICDKNRGRMLRMAVAMSSAVSLGSGFVAFGDVAAAATGSCQRSQLAAHLVDGPDTANTPDVLVAFRNTGTRTCTLDGHPALRFVDKLGHSLANPARLTGAAQTIAVDNHAHVVLELATRRGGAPSATCPAVAAPWATLRHVDSPFELSTTALPLEFSLCAGVVVHESAVASAEGPVHHVGA